MSWLLFDGFRENEGVEVDVVLELEELLELDEDELEELLELDVDECEVVDDDVVELEVELEVVELLVVVVLPLVDVK